MPVPWVYTDMKHGYRYVPPPAAQAAKGPEGKRNAQPPSGRHATHTPFRVPHAISHSTAAFHDRYLRYSLYVCMYSLLAGGRRRGVRGVRLGGPVFPHANPHERRGRACPGKTMPLPVNITRRPAHSVVALWACPRAGARATAIGDTHGRGVAFRSFTLLQGHAVTRCRVCYSLGSPIADATLGGDRAGGEAQIRYHVGRPFETACITSRTRLLLAFQNQHHTRWQAYMYDRALGHPGLSMPHCTSIWEHQGRGPFNRCQGVRPRWGVKAGRHMANKPQGVRTRTCHSQYFLSVG